MPDNNLISILFIEDNPDDHLLMKMKLRSDGIQFLENRVQTVEDLIIHLEKQDYDIFIVDYDISGYYIDQFLQILISHNPDTSIIVVSGTMVEEQVLKAMQFRARDYVMKDNLRRLPVAVRKEYRNALSRRELRETRKKADRVSELLKLYFENVDDVVSVHFLDGKYKYISPSAEKFYGFSEAEILTQGGLEFVHPDDRDLVQGNIDKPTNEYDKTHTLQWRRLHKNGHYIWLETKSKYVLDEQRQPIEIVCASRNITDVERTEEALELSENRFKILVQNSTDIFSIIDNQGQLLYISPAFFKITGYTESDVINKNMFSFLHPEDVQMVRNYFEIELNNPDSRQLYTYRFRTANGNYRYFETRGSSQLVDASVKSVVLSTRDITDRIESQELIAFQNKNINALSESTIGYLNLSVDDDHFSYIANQLVNLLPSAMIIVNEYSDDKNKLICRNIIGLDKINRVLAKYSNQIAEGSHFQPTIDALESLKEAKLVQVEGGLYQLLFRSCPQRICNYVQEAAGIESVYSMGLVWNNRLYGNVVIITFEDTPSVNKGVVETFISVASVALQRKRTEDLVIRSLREKEVMLKEIHHRVKNNLQIVSSLLELQAFQISDPDTKLLFEDSQARVRSMALVHERIYKSQDLANINYREYLEELIQYLFESFQTDNVKHHISAENIMMSIDAAVPVGIIINELVTNSLKYAFPGGQEGTVSIVLKQNNDLITLIIEDNGIGLPKHIRVGKHPTLGLELVNALTLQLNASIETDTSNGTKYTIELTC